MASGLPRAGRNANPPDLALALAANPDAVATFARLDAANRYAIFYRLNIVRRPATRDRKLIEYVDMLARDESIYPRKPDWSQRYQFSLQFFSRCSKSPSRQFIEGPRLDRLPILVVAFDGVALD